MLRWQALKPRDLNTFLRTAFPSSVIASDGTSYIAVFITEIMEVSIIDIKGGTNLLPTFSLSACGHCRSEPESGPYSCKNTFHSLVIFIINSIFISLHVSLQYVRYHWFPHVYFQTGITKSSHALQNEE